MKISRKFGILVLLLLVTIITLIVIYQSTGYLYTDVTLLKVKATNASRLNSVYRASQEVSFIKSNSSGSSQDLHTTHIKSNQNITETSYASSNSPLFGMVIQSDKRMVLPSQNLSQLLQVGRRKYSVISASTPSNDRISRYNYVFSIPLAILAWKRLGFQTIVLISGDKREWEKDPCLKVITDYMNDLKAVAVFLNVPEDKLIMMAQVSRIYAASILSDQLKDNDYLVTSDVDLWPIDGSAYMLSRDKRILILNAGCCGSFRHKDKLHHTVAMGNVGATAKTWREMIVSKGDMLPKNSSDILDIFVNTFGDVARRRTVKGENEGWYLDQHMLSVLLSSWMENNDISLVQFMPRNVGRDRVDRSWWSTDTIKGKIDVHVLDNLHLTGNWLKVLPLFRLMFGSDEYSSLYSLTLLYFNDFNSAMESINSFKFS